MPWLPFVLISMFAFSINSILFRSIMKQSSSDPYAQTIMLFIVGGFFALCISLALGKLHWPSTQEWIILGAAATVSTVGSVMNNYAYKLIEASEVTILSSSQRFFSVVGAFIFLGELFNPTKLLATFLILIGVGVASWKKHTIRFDKGALFVLGAAVLFSSADMMSYFLLKTLDNFTFTTLGYIIPIVLIVVFRPKTLGNIRFYTKKKNLVKIVTAGSLDCIGFFSFYYAYTLGHNASVITPLAGARIIITIILGYILLKEDDYLVQKFIGAAIIITGSLLLFL